MTKVDVLNLILKVVSLKDSYYDAESKMRLALGKWKDEKKISVYDIRSDPSSSEHTIYIMEPGHPKPISVRVDFKKLDPDMVVCMDVLER